MPRKRPKLTEASILRWADAHRRRTGQWPVGSSGRIAETDVTWGAVDRALRIGLRGLPGGSSLPDLLARRRGKVNPLSQPLLTERQIVAWAQRHHQRTGSWPTIAAGEIPGSKGRTWRKVNSALQAGCFGLPGGSSLARLLARECGRQLHPPPLNIRQILKWADAQHDRTGQWPARTTGAVLDAPGETWARIDDALQDGYRGLPGGSSIAKLLAVHGRKANRKKQPKLTVQQILRWADAHRRRTGQWPIITSGVIPEGQGRTWNAINMALRDGRSGLPGGRSLAALLAEHRGRVSKAHRPRLCIDEILQWADDFHQSSGHWPSQSSGDVAGVPGVCWSTIDQALRGGRHGLPGGSSLADLLRRHRAKGYYAKLPPLTCRQIVEWAQYEFECSRSWPTVASGPVWQAPEENWSAINQALRTGFRGFPGHASLAKVLDRWAMTPYEEEKPALTTAQVLLWADEHRQRHGRWPTTQSGKIEGTRRESWIAVDQALREGLRGFPGYSSLWKLLRRHRSSNRTQLRLRRGVARQAR